MAGWVARSADPPVDHRAEPLVVAAGRLDEPRDRNSLEQETKMRSSTIAVTAALLLAAGGASAQSPSDAQIAHIVVTANQVDIDAGKLAESKGSSKDVKDFGKMMVTDHSGVNKQAKALATKLKVRPEDNPTSQSLKQGGQANVKTLKGLKGSEFDKAYIDHEVAYHQSVLDAVDKTLIPSAQNAELKDLLVKTRPAFVAHLEKAKDIQSKLGK
jgi:putative membrane protein